MTGPIHIDDLECPRCGRRGTLEIPRNAAIGEDVPVECKACGRQHSGRREPLDSVFDFSGGKR